MKQVSYAKINDLKKIKTRFDGDKRNADAIAKIRFCF